MRFDSLKSSLSIVIFLFTLSNSFAQCDGLDVDAGKDHFVCPDDVIDLEGTIDGSYLDFNWEPQNLVSDAFSLSTTGFAPGTYTLVAYAPDNTNLIQNGDFSQGINGFTSDYNFVPGPGLGFGWGDYSVGNDPSGYNASFQNCNDVTGEGMMMIIDGSDVGGLDLWCQTVAITPNTLYFFSFSSTSCLVDINPARFTVSFNGTVISNFSDSGVSCGWQENETSWNSGGASSVSICIRDVNIDPLGNDFVMDDIKMFGSCKKEDQITIEEAEMPLDGNLLYPFGCTNDQINLILSSYPQSGPYTVNWTTNDGNVVSSLQLPPYTATVNSAGTYIAELVYDDGFTECRKEIEIIVKETNVILEALAEEKKALECASNGILFAQDTTENFKYSWYTIDGSIVSYLDSSTIEVSSIGTYFLIEFDPISGCKDTTEITISASLDFPNALITNNDTINCINSSSFFLIGTSSTITANDKYEWSTLDGTFRGTTNTLIPGISTSGTYSLAITDTITGCADTAFITIIADYLEPTTAFPDTIFIDCDNKSFDLFNTSTNSSEVYYFWTQNGFGYIIDTFLVNQDGQIIVETKFNISECFTTDTIEVVSDADIPVIQFEEDFAIDCLNDEVNILLDRSYNDALNYTWSTNNGNILSDTDSNTILIDQVGVYYIHIINPDNNCSALDSIVIVEDFNLPAVSTQDTSFFPCGVMSIVINASTDLTFPNLQYQWETSNGSFLTTPYSDQLEVDAPGAYQFIILNPDNGCADTVTHTVVPDQNIPTLTTSGLDTIDCITQSINLSATGVSNTGANISYNWSTTDGNIMGNSNIPSINILEPGTYRIEITDNANDCINSSTITIDIDTIAPIISFASNINIDCSSQTVNIQAEQADNPIFSYNWSTTDGTLPSNSSIPSITINSAGTYTLEVINPKNGCSNNENITVGIDTISPTANIISPDILTCQQTSIVLDASSSDIGVDYLFNWTYPISNIDFSDLQRPIITVPGRYVLTIQNINNNCIDSSVVIVTSNQAYPIIQLNEPDSLGCNHSTTSISAIITSGAVGHSSNWMTSNGNITSGTNSNSITVDEQGLYYITVVDLENACVTTDSIFINGMASGPTEFQLDINNGICFEDISSYTVLNILGGEAPYQAKLNGQAIILDQQQDISPGDYILVVSDNNGCRISDTFTIFPAQQYPINIGLDFQITAGDPTKLIPQFGFDTTTIASLQWSPSDALSCDSCFVTDFIASQSTEITLLAITEDGCEATADIFITVVPGKDVFIPSAFSPNSDKLNDFLTVFTKNGRVAQVKSMVVFNRWGDQVFLKENFQPNLEDQGWDGKHNGQELDSGVYIFAVEVEFIDGSVRLFAGDITLVK